MDKIPEQQNKALKSVKQMKNIETMLKGVKLPGVNYLKIIFY